MIGVSNWKPSKSLLDTVKILLILVNTKLRRNHIEERVGLLNISVVGRNCSQKQRRIL